MSEVSAFIIAGGKSTRMGEDKAFVELHGTPLLLHMLAIARQVATDIHIVGDPQKFSAYGKTIADIFPDCGPLGGIHAALRAANTDMNLMLAVDTPFVRPDFLRYMIHEAMATAALATVPRARGRFQPLCAVYRQVFADRAEVALRAGNNKIGTLLSPETTRIVTQEEIERLAFPLSMFDNLNTREELATARARTAHHD